MPCGESLYHSPQEHLKESYGNKFRWFFSERLELPLNCEVTCGLFVLLEWEKNTAISTLQVERSVCFFAEGEKRSATREAKDRKYFPISAVSFLCDQSTIYDSTERTREISPAGIFKTKHFVLSVF